MHPIELLRSARSTFRSWSLCWLAAAPLTAQVVSDGYQTATRSLPVAASSFAAVADGIVWFDGSDLMFEPSGLPPRSLLHFAAARFGSFTLPLGNGQLLFGESTFDELWLVPTLAGGTPRLLTTLHFAYDAARLGSNRAIVSAKTGGFSAGANDLIAVDLQTGSQVPIGLIAGASGPVLLDEHGDLLYATAPSTFPPPPGAVEILRWTATTWALALAGGPLLTRNNAQLVLGGLDSAGDLALDRDGDLFFTDYANARIGEVDDLTVGAVGSHVLVDYSTTSVAPANVAFVAATADSAAFEPFAAGPAGTLLVLETDFFATTVLRTLQPRAATARTAPAGIVPAGPLALVVQDGPPLGAALFVIGLLRTDVLLPMRLPGFEQTIGWDAGLLYPLAWGLEPCDPNGTAAWNLVNPGFAQGLAVHSQSLFVTADGAQLGATGPLTTTLGR